MRSHHRNYREVFGWEVVRQWDGDAVLIYDTAVYEGREISSDKWMQEYLVKVSEVLRNLHVSQHEVTFRLRTHWAGA
jgi:hypothetical protein